MTEYTEIEIVGKISIPNSDRERQHLVLLDVDLDRQETLKVLWSMSKGNAMLLMFVLMSAAFALGALAARL